LGGEGKGGFADRQEKLVVVEGGGVLMIDDIDVRLNETTINTAYARERKYDWDKAYIWNGRTCVRVVPPTTEIAAGITSITVTQKIVLKKRTFVHCERVRMRETKAFKVWELLKKRSRHQSLPVITACQSKVIDDGTATKPNSLLRIKRSSFGKQPRLR
jgi:hypothetical protein